MSKRSVVLGTAGHIDHGKSSLVYALTGTDPDRLPEEKSRGITIDLGFASLPLPCANFSIVDVPGHHAFIRNMLAGAGGIDCVLLVIAADEGVKPQTAEHLAICTLLGIRHGVVVLTKADLVAPTQREQAQQQVRSFLNQSFLAQAPVLSVSARTGEGLAELKSALCQLASHVAPPGSHHTLRLPVDRAFAVRGFGTVVTGTLHAGTVRAGDHLLLEPGSRAVRVRGIQMHGAAAALAEAPTRVALNLSGVEVAEVRRGDTLTLPGTLAPTQAVDVELTELPGEPLPRHRSLLQVHAFCSETTATVLRYEEGSPLARLRLREPMLLLPGDRLVLRQPARAATVGGGRVLDAHPVARQRKARTLTWLRGIRDAPAPALLVARVDRRGTAGCTRGDLTLETGLTAAALEPLLAPLLAGLQLVQAGDLLLTPEALQRASGQLLAAITRAEGQTLSRAELASHTRLPTPVFAAAWTRLSADGGIEASANQLSLRKAAKPAEDPALQRLETLYRSAGLAAPLVSEAAAKLGLSLKAAPPLITQLLRAGKLVRMGSDNLLIHTDALLALRAQLASRRGARLDVAQFKALTGLSRKHAIPLLEYLDGVRATRNENGIRVVL